MEGKKQGMESEKTDFIDKKIKISLSLQQTYHTEGLWKGKNKKWNQKRLILMTKKSKFL